MYNKKNIFGLKKIIILLFLIVLLASCGKTTEVIENDNMSEVNLITDTQKLDIIEGNNTESIDGSDIIFHDEILIIKEEKEIGVHEIDRELLWKIRSGKDAYNFYFLDCKKVFKTEKYTKECQELSLREINIGCGDMWGEKPMGKQDLEKLLNVNKFDLLEKSKVMEVKKSCETKRNKIQEEEKKIKEQLNKQKERDQKINSIAENFKLSDCQKHFSGKSLSKQIQDIKNNKNIPEEFKSDMISSLEKNYIDPVKQCKIGFAINYKKTCSILSGELKEECIQVKPGIEAFKIMQENHRKYGNFNVLNELMNNKFEKQGFSVDMGPMGMGGFNDGMGDMGMGGFVR